MVSGDSVADIFIACCLLDTPCASAIDVHGFLIIGFIKTVWTVRSDRRNETHTVCGYDQMIGRLVDPLNRGCKFNNTEAVSGV